MKNFYIITCIFLLQSCAGISGFNYHASTNKTTKYFDCGAFLGEPRTGFILNVFGHANSEVVTQKGNDILICSLGHSRESLYFLGPIIPIIPLFGVGDNTLPKELKFSILNQSDNKSVKFINDDIFEYCLKKQESYTRCEKKVSIKSSIDIPSKSILQIKTKYKNEIILKLQLDDGEEISFKFKEHTGLFFIFTAELSDKRDINSNIKTTSIFKFKSIV